MLNPASKGEPYVVASTSGVKTRKGPGTGHTQLGALGLGSVVSITKISPDGEWGYAASAQLGDGSWGTTSGVWINLEPCVKGTPTKWVVTTSSGLNLRANADVGSTRQAVLPKDTSLTVTTIEKKGDYTWGFVAYAYSKERNEYWMSEGWVALDYCKQLG